MADFTIADLTSSTAVDIVILSSLTAKHVSQEMDDWMTKRRVRIEGEELAVVEDLCRKLPIAESMRCHEPPLGLRFYRNEHLLCAFSICWRCNNAFGEYEGKPIFFRFDGRSADGTDYLGPSVSIDDFERFHEQLGFTIVDHDDYHPFFHEILTVHPTRNNDAQIELADYAWPCLMLGDMSYCRAGVIVDGGSNYVNRSIAESSTLYWTYRRKDRPYRDLSQGWGHNSQWRTEFRRDFHRSMKFHFNVDGKQSLNDPSTSVDDLPKAAMIELVRNRGMIFTDVGDDSDLFPYDYTYSEHA